MKITQEKYDGYKRQILRDITILKLTHSPSVSTIMTGIIGALFLYFCEAPSWAYIFVALITHTYDKTNYGETASRMTLVKLEALIEHYFNPHENEDEDEDEF